jgi:alcohol dehydrogenase
MVQNVEVKDITSGGSQVTCLVISFNTDAGKQDINIPISDIFDASNYYTKSETSGATELSTAFDAVNVSIDAVNHVVEAATSAVASPYSIMLAKEVIELVAKYLPKAISNPEDLEARYFLAYAAMMGGVSFDNGLLHYTHALEHPLSAVKPDLSHGLGLAILLPAVVKTIYKDKAATLADILAPVVPNLKGTPDEAQKAADGVYAWLKSVDVGQKLEDEGFSASDVDKLTDLAFTTPSLDGLIGIGPSGNSRELVRNIYQESLKA